MVARQRRFHQVGEIKQGIVRMTREEFEGLNKPVPIAKRRTKEHVFFYDRRAGTGEEPARRNRKPYSPSRSHRLAQPRLFTRFGIKQQFAHYADQSGETIHRSSAVGKKRKE